MVWYQKSLKRFLKGGTKTFPQKCYHKSSTMMVQKRFLNDDTKKVP